MFNWLRDLFSPNATLRASTPHIEAVAAHHNGFNDGLTFSDHSRVYQQASWVHVAVSRIAEAGALVPLRVLRVAGDQQLEVSRHPLERLLDYPNPAMSRFELFEATLGYLELTGNAYWYIAGDDAGRPSAIWPLRPDRVTVVPHPTHYVAGYLYEVDGQRIPLDKIQVVHFKRWHPGNDYYGLSALEAARLAVENDRAMARWNQQTFGRDQGVPAGIVNIHETVSDGDFERIKREWRSSYGGGQRRTAFLRGGAVSWQHIGLSHTDLDFLKGRLAHRDEILNIFGIPVGLVSENATEANAKVAERLFIERTLWPKLVRIAQKITQELLPFYAGEHVAAFEDIRPTDVQARLAEIRTAQTALSINEIRERYYQLPPVVWGTLPAGDVTQPAPDDERAAVDHKAALSELAQWERFALNRLDQPASRPFKVAVLPDEVAFEVSAGLLDADNREAVQAVFDACREVVTTGEV